jgi:hypothetical protein
MSTESIQTEAPPPHHPLAPSKRACRTDDEVAQALRAAGGKIPATATALGMSYHAVYHRVHKKPRLLQRWASPKVRKKINALLAKIPRDFFGPEGLSANTGDGRNRRAGVARERRLMEQGRADDGAAFLPALVLCRGGALYSYLRIEIHLRWISGELRSLEALARAGHSDFGRERRLRNRQIRLFRLQAEFMNATQTGLESRFEAENKVGGAAAA